jgi:glycosyltransferase involved in cell wall biosynthesis
MKKTPIISIIIPVYNAEKHIVKCFESIQNQTFLDYEVVIINDGSVDNSKSIIEQFIHNYKNWFLYSKINEGTGISRNFGIKKTRGKYIAFVDVDDFLEKDYLEKLYKELICSDIDLACCGYNDHSFKGIVSLNNYKDRSSDIIGVNEFSKIIFSQIGGVLWDKLFVADIIRKNKLKMDKNIYFYEDSLFIIDYLKFCKKISILEEPLYNYNRINETSYTNRIDHTWKVNVVNFNKEIVKRIGLAKEESEVIVQKNISSFVLTIFQYEKLIKYTFVKKYKIITNFINDVFIVENFKSKTMVFYNKPFVFLFKYKMILIIILYSWLLFTFKKKLKFLKKLNESIFK